VVLAVQQLEGNVLQPLLMGRAVSLHPLAVVLAVSAGVVISGITGALLAVPLLAVVNTAVRSLNSDRRPPPGSIDAVDPRHALPGTEPAGPRGPSRLTRLLRGIARRTGAQA
jgi:putative heme transporter